MYAQTKMMVWKIIYKKKKKLHPGDSVSLVGVLESGFISGRLPDDLGGFTCISERWKKGKMEKDGKIKSHHLGFLSHNKLSHSQDV